MSSCKAKFDEMPDLNVHIASAHEVKKPLKNHHRPPFLPPLTSSAKEALMI